MWTYEQSTGNLYDSIGELVAIGYSGFGAGKNTPSAQNEPNIGPVPCGYYAIGAPFDTATHGPFVLRLTPNAEDEMFGRSGFLIHGDSVAHAGSASHGCIILGRDVREKIAASGDNLLHVEAGVL